MRNLNYILIFFSLLFLAVSCSEDKRLEHNAQKGLKAFYSGDFDKAARYSTPRSKEILMEMKELIGTDRLTSTQKGIFNIKLINTTRSSTSAEITYEVINESIGRNKYTEFEISNIKEVARMEKIDGHWLLEFEN
ncbi:MAG: hypothetical protein ACRC6R_06260 [Bacteroidales bacterium]